METLLKMNQEARGEAVVPWLFTKHKGLISLFAVAPTTPLPSTKEFPPLGFSGRACGSQWLVVQIAILCCSQVKTGLLEKHLLTFLC